MQQPSKFAVIIFPVPSLPESSSAESAGLVGDNQRQDGAENDDDGQSHRLAVYSISLTLSLLSQFSGKIRSSIQMIKKGLCNH